MRNKDWIKHDGKGIPVHPETLVECLHGDGWNHYGPRLASWHNHWKNDRDSHHNILMYRVITPAFHSAPALDDVGSGP